MALRPVPPPIHDPLVQENRLVTDTWVLYLSDQGARVSESSRRVGSVALTAQVASIGATSVPIQTISGGLYRLSYYARITTAAGGTSSLSVTFGWTETSIALSTTAAAVTGNSVLTISSGTRVILSDSGSPITYATTYASTGTPVMQYRLSILTEAVEL